MILGGTCLRNTASEEFLEPFVAGAPQNTIEMHLTNLLPVAIVSRINDPNALQLVAVTPQSMAGDLPAGAPNAHCCLKFCVLDGCGKKSMK